MLNNLVRARGQKYRRLRKQAVAYREKLLNKKHPEDDLPKAEYDYGELKRKMPDEYRKQLKQVLGTKEGKAALKRYRAFTGLPYPPEIKVLEMPGPKAKTQVLVGMGYSPEVQVADGPEGQAQKVKKIKGKKLLATDASGRRMFVLSGQNSQAEKPELDFLGYAPETHYILTPGEEKAGTFKRGKYWVHEHLDEGGKWPKVYKDQAGNIVYGPGTFTVGKWIRR